MLKSSFFFFIWNGACTLRFRQTPICCRVRIVKHSQLSETVSKIYVLEHRERMPVSSANERALPSSLHLYFMAMRPETDRLYSQFYWAKGHQTWRSLKSPHSVSCLDWKKNPFTQKQLFMGVNSEIINQPTEYHCGCSKSKTHCEIIYFYILSLNSDFKSVSTLIYRT